MNSMTRNSWQTAGWGAAAALLMIPSISQAIPMRDGIVVRTAGGDVVAEKWATEAEILAAGPTGLFYIDMVGLVDLSQFELYTAVYEPGGNGTTGPWSDIFGVAQVSGDYYLGFMSGPGSASIADGAAFTIEELPGGMDMTMYLSPGMRQDNFTATFYSSAPEAAPDTGGTLALLGLGLGSVLLSRRLKP